MLPIWGMDSCYYKKIRGMQGIVIRVSKHLEETVLLSEKEFIFPLKNTKNLGREVQGLAIDTSQIDLV